MKFNSMHKLFLCLTLLTLQFLKAQNSFQMASKTSTANIVIDKSDAKVVEIAANLLANDVFNITKKKPEIVNKLEDYAIIAGTIGSSKWIDKLINSKKIDVSTIKTKWETFKIILVDNPFQNIEKALVVVGSDRRATAYGLLELSRQMGVSPWEWWADVTPEPKIEISITVDNTKIYGNPSVKYRGVFLNDEDWGLQRWAALTYEPETGDIGPKTYAKVFELLLRLRANTIWPAMHKSTKAFYFYPKNKEVADDYAIVIGSSHAEPMLSNINAEWNHETMGEYRYDTNSESIKSFFKKRAKETANYDGIYTIGMRGEHDSPMIVGEDDTDSQVKLLEKVITDQRAILKANSKKGEHKPQAFVPYKEVLHYYQSGLNLPEDITLVWTDDNYGYIRQLSNPEEQKRIGGAGVYYHTSYWGRPHDYLWLNSTSPALMWEEMLKAYQFNSQDLWILNVGDIKPHEYNMELFLDMAWDMAPFQNNTYLKTHKQNWAKREFGEKYAEKIADILSANDVLAFKRRPEFMAWSQVEPVTKSGVTELSQFHYGDEVSKRISAFNELLEQVEAVKPNLPEHRKDAFYQLVYYPIVAAANQNNKWLYAYKSKFVAKQGRFSATAFAKESEDAFNTIKAETDYYNTKLKNGKWNHIMTMQPRFLPVFDKPDTAIPASTNVNDLGIALESYQMELNNKVINSYADVLPVFNAYTKNTYYIDVFLKGNQTLNWEAKPEASWIKLSQSKGVLNIENPEERIYVTIDWNQVPKGENKKEAPLGHDYQLIPPSYKVNSAINFSSNENNHKVGVSVFNPELEDLKNFKGFVEDKGFVSINAENATRKTKGAEANWETYEGLGYTNKVAVALPRSAKSITDASEILKDSPMLEYDFYSFNFGEVNINVQAIPTHAFFEGYGVRCALAIDDAEPEIIDFQTFGRSDAWKQNVLKNAAIKSAKGIVNKAGKHTLKIWMVDPGVMIDQILIDFGGWKDSYAFPEETRF
ncbi:hypothetical protein PK35_02905 [Tamlana nanhaiensis]|uniref:Gylcosyl hydrolase 115 C-terminal domain-containing protein n=2 Tax=Neotamlana nanhaiensis TaxID=1382798 RepID=A0A0D7WAE8_9FLAO|nr:hypothetical protein PK35_02905 [Tamlana nanhaiensis]